MIPVSFSLLPATRLHAGWNAGTLQISASGAVEGSVRDAQVRRSPTGIEPPLYEVVGQVDKTTPIVEPFEALGSFEAALSKWVHVVTATGTVKVKVDGIFPDAE